MGVCTVFENHTKACLIYFYKYFHNQKSSPLFCLANIQLKFKTEKKRRIAKKKMRHFWRFFKDYEGESQELVSHSCVPDGQVLFVL